MLAQNFITTLPLALFASVNPDKQMKELHQSTLYRTQRLIRMGEWLEHNMHAMCLAFEVIDRAHDELMEREDCGLPTLEDLVEMVFYKQMSALQALMPCMRDMRNGNAFEAEMGKDVTLHHPNGCKDHRYEVVIEAPKPSESTKQAIFAPQIADLPEANNADS